MDSPTLTKTVGEMFAKPEGQVSSDFQGKGTVVCKKIPFPRWIFVVGIIPENQGRMRRIFLCRCARKVRGDEAVPSS